MCEKCKQLEQDINDLMSFCDARRCRKCAHYYLDGFICQCGHDNSASDDNESEEY